MALYCLFVIHKSLRSNTNLGIIDNHSHYEFDMNAPLMTSLNHDNCSVASSTRALSHCDKYEPLIITELQQHNVFGKQEATVTNRLKELGFLPGAALEIIGFGLLGRDPIAVRINGTKFALRKAEASKVMVQAANQFHV